MENQTAYDLLLTFIISVRTSKAEIRFRAQTGLCAKCGMARRVPGEAICSYCCEERDNQLMQDQWKAWGIAA